MEMEVMIPVVAAAAVDFNFDSTCSSPYMTAPSSPQRFGNYYFSAPTSPSASTATFYHHFAEQSGIQKSKDEEDKSLTDDDDRDFEFNFSGPLNVPRISAADELFDGGKIRPLRPHSFADAENSQTRGRQRSSVSSSSSSSSNSNSSYQRRESRSLPPLRVSDVLIEQEEITENTKAVISKTSNSNSNSKSYASTILSAISFSKGYKKWKLKDLLFRSASEGREPLTKYSVLNGREVETPDVKNAASFRSSEGSIGSVSKRKGGPPVSAHELHYTTNRAVSEELKRKTYLPYKHGLLGCLGFNPAGVNDISRGVGSLTRG